MYHIVGSVTYSGSFHHVALELNQTQMALHPDYAKTCMQARSDYNDTGH